MRLFEFGDMAWTPSWYHFYLRRYLVFFYRLFGYFRLWVPALRNFISVTDAKTYLELGSGGGEPLRMVVSELAHEALAGRRFVLSDINPVPEFVQQTNQAGDPRFHYHSTPVNATQIPGELAFPRIFINSFHHFRPPQAREAIEASMAAKQPVLILEYVRNTPLAYLSMLAGPLVILLTAPFLARPRDIPTLLLFTYLVPIFPLMMMWDGIVSCLRAYDQRALNLLMADNLHKAQIQGYTKRSLLYPAGVTAITILPKD